MAREDDDRAIKEKIAQVTARGSKIVADMEAFKAASVAKARDLLDKAGVLKEVEAIEAERRRVVDAARAEVDKINAELSDLRKFAEFIKTLPEGGNVPAEGQEPKAEETAPPPPPVASSPVKVVPIGRKKTRR